MADGTAPAPREYQTTEVLSSMGKLENRSLLDGLGKDDAEKKRRIEFGQRRAKDIRDNGPQLVGRDIYRKNLEFAQKAPEFDKDSQEALTNAFKESENEKEANQAVGELSNFLKYSKIESEKKAKNAEIGAQRVNGQPLSDIQRRDEEGKAFADILAKNDIQEMTVDGKKLPPEDVYRNLRSQALDSLINSEYMQKNFGDALNAFPNIESRRAFIEQTLLSRPDLQQKIAKGMAEVVQKAKDLPAVKDNEKTVAAKEAKSKAETQIKLSTDRAVDVAKSLGLLNDKDGNPLTDAGEIAKREQEVRDLISANMKDGERSGVNASLDQLRNKLIALNPDVQVVNEYRVAKSILDELDKASVEATNRAKGAPAGTEEAQKALQAFQEAEKKYKGTMDAYKALSADSAKLTKASDLLDTINLKTTSAEKDGEFMGSLARDLGKVAESNKQIRDADDEIAKNTTEDDAANEAARTERQRQESGLLKSMNEMMANAIADIMEEQYDAMTAADKARIEKEGSEMARIIAEKMSTNWISYDREKRKQNKTANRDQMANDMSFLIYNGENGVKQLLMRDLGLVPKGADGRDLPLSLKDRNNLAYMDKLTEEQKQQVEAAYAKFGADYSKKLMTDFFMARGFADRTVSVLGMEKTMGALALKDNEWKLLNDNFGGVEELSKIFAASQTGSKSEVMKAFRDQGIVPDSPKAKWMLAILAALGLAVAAPIIGVSTVGVAPVAIGAAALGGVALAAGAGTSFDMH